jgi:F-type H+-transporting ATPase subunit delta
MIPSLEGYAAAVLGDASLAERERVAEQLEAVDAAVQTRDDLRAALTDTALSGEVRSAVLRDLLTGRVDEPTVRLAAYAARVCSGQNLSATLSDLTHYASRRARPEPYVPESLSLLEARRRVAGYADARLEGLDTDQFSSVEDDLFRWARTVEANPELRRVLVDRDAAVGARQALTRGLLEGKVHPTSLALCLFGVEGGRPRDVVGTLDFLVDYVARARDWRVARVRTARELDESARAALTASLETISGRRVELQVTEDPTLLGGVLVEIGDLRLDATTRGQLETLHDTIAGALGGELLTNRSN